MDTVTRAAIIGIDVSRDWLDIHCLSNGQRQRLPNTDAGQAQVVDLASSLKALVCFEVTGGQEWRLWAALDAAGIEVAYMIRKGQFDMPEKPGFEQFASLLG